MNGAPHRRLGRACGRVALVTYLLMVRPLFRRAGLSFLRWQANRGILNPIHADRPGSSWWRAINERLLRDGCESVVLVGGLRAPSSPTVGALAVVHRGSTGAQLVSSP